MNVKVFKNGVVQITGIREIEQGKMLIDKLIEIIKKCVDDHPNLVSDKTKLQNVGYTVHLINSDFSVGFSVKQDKLYRLMKRDYSAHECSYEPCIYPGVKITYYYNANNDGVCRCDEYCGVKTRRNQSNMCKKITIAVFKSGNTIITGAKSYEHTNVAYKFIRQILEENRKEVEMIHHTELQQQLLNDTKQEKQGRVYLIHRSRFQYEITE
jgi:TATA-box binding protein (TBP) (component of TFIID and TFIIIB)